MSDVVKAVNHKDNGKIHNRFEREIDKLNRLQSLTYLLEAISDFEYRVREHQGSDLTYEIDIKNSYPQQYVVFSYRVNSESGDVRIAPIYANNYSVIDFIDSIEDKSMKHGRYGELVVNEMFKIKLMQQILGKKLFEEYCEKSFDLKCYV